MLNLAEMPTGDFTRDRTADLHALERRRRIEEVVGADNLTGFDAQRAAEVLMGDTVFANVMMLGAAWQLGLAPVGLEAMLRAIELNGVAVEKNKRAFAWGRIAIVASEEVARLIAGEPVQDETLDEVIARREAFLTDYQSAAWSKRWRDRVEQVRAAEATAGGDGRLADAVARSLFKLMSYKDEYEVARLHTGTGFVEGLGERFEGDFSVSHHLAPPLFPSGKDRRGRPKKRRFGGWIRRPMGMLARLKGLRGTPLDVFGYTAERRMERAMIGEYEAVVDRLLAGLRPDNTGEATRIAALVHEIRGFGPVKEAAAARVRPQIGHALAVYEHTLPKRDAA